MFDRKIADFIGHSGGTVYTLALGASGLRSLEVQILSVAQQRIHDPQQVAVVRNTADSGSFNSILKVVCEGASVFGSIPELYPLK